MSEPSAVEFLSAALTTLPVFLILLFVGFVHYVKVREAQARGDHHTVRKTLEDALRGAEEAMEFLRTQERPAKVLKPKKGPAPPQIALQAREGSEKPSCALCRDGVGKKGWHCDCGVALHRRCRKELGKGCPTPGCS